MVVISLFEGLPDTKEHLLCPEVLLNFWVMNPRGLEKTLDWLEDVHSRGAHGPRTLLQVQCAEGLWQGLFSVR